MDTEDTDPFKTGEGIADGCPDFLGIFVGVSFGREVETFNDERGGMLGSLKPLCAPSPVVATDGDPAIVGSWPRVLRSDVSDCLCNELIVGAVTRELTLAPPLLETDETGVDVDELRLATRCAVT